MPGSWGRTVILKIAGNKEGLNSKSEGKTANESQKCNYLDGNSFKNATVWGVLIDFPVGTTASAPAF